MLGYIQNSSKVLKFVYMISLRCQVKGRQDAMKRSVRLLPGGMKRSLPNAQRGFSPICPTSLLVMHGAKPSLNHQNPPSVVSMHPHPSLPRLSPYVAKEA